MPSTETHVSVGLVYQAAALNAHLKQALSELGARVVYDRPAAEFVYADLDATGAEVVVVNLDPDVGDEFAALDDLLTDESRRVVFNDGEVSSRLAGWDQARWARHLAAKIMGLDEIMPPRPEGSLAVPVRAKAGPERAGEAAGAGFEIPADDLHRALNADLHDALRRERAALTTDLEPVAPKLQDRRESMHEVVDVPLSAEQMLNLFGREDAMRAVGELTEGAPKIEIVAEPDFGLADMISEAAAVSVDTAAPEFPNAGSGFSFLEEPGFRPEPASDLPAATATEEWGGIALAPLEDEFAAAPASPSPAAVSPKLDESEWSALGVFDLEPLTEEPAVAPVAAAKPAPVPAPEFDLDGLSLEPIDDEEAPARAVASGAGVATVAAPVPAAASAVLATTLELPVPNRSALDATLELPVPRAAALDATLELPVPRAAVLDTTLELPVPTRSAFDTTLELPVPDTSALDTTLELPVPQVIAASSAPALDFDFEDAASSFKFSDFEAPPSAETPALQSDDELMRQFQAIFNDEDYVAPVAQGPVRNVWVLGASIGGPEAVREFLGGLSPETPALFLLAQHMGSDFLELMTQQLSKSTHLRVRHVHDGERVAYGDLVVVPLHERLRVDGHGDVRVSALEQVSSYTPSIDMVLKDVADAFGGNAGAIIFSGMAHDGVDGTRYLHQKGGQVWVQDPKTCVVSSMVDGACEAGIVEFAGSPQELARQFVARFPA